jgi:hypothetical protein
MASPYVMPDVFRHPPCRPFAIGYETNRSPRQDIYLAPPFKGGDGFDYSRAANAACAAASLAIGTRYGEADT